MTTQTTPSIEDAKRTNAGVFTQADVQAARRLRLSGGIRGDVVRSANEGGYFGDREVTNANIAGSAAATFMPVASLTLTGQLSRGFREPMLMDRFYRGPVGRGFIEGNPDLEPETSLQLDVIARYDTGGVALSSALYDYRISNLIERYQAGPNSFLFRNRSAARIRGVELEARAALPHAFVLSVTAQSSRGRDDDDGTPLDDIAPASISLVTRHSLRAVSSYIRVTGFRLARRRRAERGTDSRLLSGRCRRLLARDATSPGRGHAAQLAERFLLLERRTALGVRARPSRDRDGRRRVLTASERTHPVYAILPRIWPISSAEKARSVWVRTLPSAPTLRSSALTDASSGASTIVAMSVLTQRPVDRIDSRSELLRHVLEGLRTLRRVLDVPDALIRELPEDDVGRHGSSFQGDAGVFGGRRRAEHYRTTGPRRSGPAESPSYFTDILDCRARVLVTQAARARGAWDGWFPIIFAPCESVDRCAQVVA